MTHNSETQQAPASNRHQNLSDIRAVEISFVVFPPLEPNQDLRVKQIRTLLNYPVELVVEWLKFQEVERPNQLQPNQIDELVKTMCLSWGQDKFEHPNHATNSYHKCVVESVADGVNEVAAIRAWMQIAQQSEQKQSELKAVYV